MSEEIYINVAGPAYRGAPYPEFDPLAINERNFFDGERCKNATACYNKDDNSGYVDWLAQEAECPTMEWETEVIRAFKANGAKTGCQIKVRFDVRDNGLSDEHYILEI